MVKAQARPVTHFSLAILALYALSSPRESANRSNPFFLIDDIFGKAVCIAEIVGQKLDGKRNKTLWKSRLHGAVKDKLVRRHERNLYRFQLTESGQHIVETAKKALKGVEYDTKKDKWKALLHRIHVHEGPTKKKTRAELIVEINDLERVNEKLVNENNHLKSHRQLPPLSIISPIADRDSTLPPTPISPTLPNGRVNRDRTRPAYNPYPSPTSATRPMHPARRDFPDSPTKTRTDDAPVASSSRGPLALPRSPVIDLTGDDDDDVQGGQPEFGESEPESAPSSVSDADDLCALRRELESATMDREELQAQMEELQRERHALLQQNTTLASQVLDRERELQRVRAESDVVSDELKSTEGKIKRLKENCELLERKLRLSRSILSRVEADYQARLRTSTGKVKFLTSEVARSKQALTVSNATCKALADEVTSLTVQLDTEKRTRQAERELRERQERELKAAKEEVAALNRKLEQLREKGVDLVLEMYR